MRLLGWVRNNLPGLEARLPNFLAAEPGGALVLLGRLKEYLADMQRRGLTPDGARFEPFASASELGDSPGGASGQWRGSQRGTAPQAAQSDPWFPDGIYGSPIGHPGYPGQDPWTKAGAIPPQREVPVSNFDTPVVAKAESVTGKQWQSNFERVHRTGDGPPPAERFGEGARAPRLFWEVPRWRSSSNPSAN